MRFLRVTPFLVTAAAAGLIVWQAADAGRSGDTTGEIRLQTDIGQAADSADATRAELETLSHQVERREEAVRTAEDRLKKDRAGIRDLEARLRELGGDPAGV